MENIIVTKKMRLGGPPTLNQKWQRSPKVFDKFVSDHEIRQQRQAWARNQPNQIVGSCPL